MGLLQSLVEQWKKSAQEYDGGLFGPMKFLAAMCFLFPTTVLTIDSYRRSYGIGMDPTPTETLASVSGLLTLMFVPIIVFGLWHFALLFTQFYLGDPESSAVAEVAD